MKGIATLTALIVVGFAMAFIAILLGMVGIGMNLITLSIGMLIGMAWIWVANEDDGEEYPIGNGEM